MQKESIERLRVGAYQSSREEVKRRGKERGCREEHVLIFRSFED